MIKLRDSNTTSPTQCFLIRLGWRNTLSSRPRRRESARTHGRVGARASTLRDLVSTCVTPSKEKKCGKKRVVEEESFEDFPALDCKLEKTLRLQNRASRATFCRN